MAYAERSGAIGPEHAALIRLQCTGSADVDSLRGTEIIQNLANTLPETMGAARTEFERGFLAAQTLAVGAEAFLERSDTLFRLAPMADELTLLFASGQVAELATMPALSRYAGLSFVDTYLFDGGASHLARCLYLKQLAHLGLYETCLYDEDLTAILRSPNYPQLRSLDISNRREGQNYSYEGFKVLAEAPFAGCLERLAMARRYFYEDVVEVLAELPRLCELSLEGSELGAGTIDLCGLDRQWTHLDLSRSRIGPDEARAIADSASMSQLVSLRLASNPLGTAGAAALVTSPHLGRLCTLDMGGGTRAEERVTGDFGRAMVRAPMAESLETLELSLAGLGPEGAIGLAAAPLTRLTRLNLHNNKVGDRGAVALARSPHLRGLRSLDLSGNEIADEGAYALAESSTLSGLQWLELGGAELTDSARGALQQRFGERVQLEYPWVRRRRR